MKTRNIDKDGFEQDPSYSVRLTGDQLNQIAAALVNMAISAAEDDATDSGNERIIARCGETGGSIYEQLARIDPDAGEQYREVAEFGMQRLYAALLKPLAAYDEAGDTP